MKQTAQETSIRPNGFLRDNTLRVTLNREQFNSLADAQFLEAEIFRINSEELILEKTIHVGTAPNTTKNLIRLKYIIGQ
jgi:hypothetical protein